jgi:hypothetical protein
MKVKTSVVIALAVLVAACETKAPLVKRDATDGLVPANFVSKNSAMKLTKDSRALPVGIVLSQGTDDEFRALREYIRKSAPSVADPTGGHTRAAAEADPIASAKAILDVVSGCFPATRTYSDFRTALQDGRSMIFLVDASFDYGFWNTSNGATYKLEVFDSALAKIDTLVGEGRAALLPFDYTGRAWRQPRETAVANLREQLRGRVGC